jgi:hypothetical protein
MLTNLQVRLLCAASNEYDAEAWVHAFVDAGALYQENIEVGMSPAAGLCVCSLLACFAHFACWLACLFGFLSEPAMFVILHLHPSCSAYL